MMAARAELLSHRAAPHSPSVVATGDSVAAGTDADSEIASINRSRLPSSSFTTIRIAWKVLVAGSIP